jgi:hypothetical protein
MLALHQQKATQSAVWIEQVTVVWMSLEAVVSIGAGLVAHSLLLVAFGLDSGIELLTGGILLWRCRVEAKGASLALVEQAEKQSARIVFLALIGLNIFSVWERDSLAWSSRWWPSSACHSLLDENASLLSSYTVRHYAGMRPVP